jgi:hypothetical protein
MVGITAGSPEIDDEFRPGSAELLFYEETA